MLPQIGTFPPLIPTPRQFLILSTLYTRQIPGNTCFIGTVLKVDISKHLNFATFFACVFYDYNLKPPTSGIKACRVACRVACVVSASFLLHRGRHLIGSNM